MEKSQKTFFVTEELVATHSQRFTNLLIDSIMQVVLLFIVLMFIVGNKEINEAKAYVDHLAANTLLQYGYTACIALLYYNIFEITNARTIGKLVTQTIVVDENGEKPSHETIMVRSICRLIPFNALSIIGFPARTWHDSISKTYVVNKNLLEERKRLFYAMTPTQTEE